MKLTLSYPPSANHYWRRNGHRYFIAPAGVSFRAQVREVVAAWQSTRASWATITGPVELLVTLVPGDRRRRDIDNVLKPLLDALTQAGVWADDSQVKRLIVGMGSPEPKQGRCIVTIKEIPCS